MKQDEEQQRDELFGLNARRISVAGGRDSSVDGERTSRQGNVTRPLTSETGCRGEWNAAALPDRELQFDSREQEVSGQQLSWDQLRDEIEVAERQQGLRSAYESVEIGRGTLESLEDHKERLERSEMVLDSTKYVLERSARVLRGMNFWGKIANAFSSDPQIPFAGRPSTGADGTPSATTPGLVREGIQEDDSMEGFICPECLERFPTADGLIAHYRSAHDKIDESSAIETNPTGAAGWVTPAPSLEAFGVGETPGTAGPARVDGTHGVDSLKEQLFSGRGQVVGVGQGFPGEMGVIAEQRAFMAAQDDYLDAVGEAVRELGILGRNIGASLEHQSSTLGRVAEKTEEADERAMFVTRKAARQTQKSRPKKPTFVMSVAFQEVSTGLYLTVRGEEAALESTDLLNACRFEAWQRQEGIVGLKSSVTRRWFGQNFLGQLRVTGNQFNRNGEWQVNLRRKETFLVCCSANWGAGGYLVARADPPLSVNTSGVQRTFGDASALHGSGEVLDGRELQSVVTRAQLGLMNATMENKPRAARFRVVDCDGYVPQSFVGGKLVRPPKPPDGGNGRPSLGAWVPGEMENGA